MATVLQLVQGATTVDLNDVTNREVQEEYTTTAEDSRIDRVDESITVIIKGANTAGLMTNRSAVIAILEAARNAQDNAEQARVYVKFQPNGASSAWRSEILDYRIANETGVYAMPWDWLCTELTITWTRRNYWEADSETQIPLTNTSATNNTSGLTLYNHWDAGTGHVNYAQIAAADVVGDLPAPCRIEITNTQINSNDTLDYVWVGHNYKDPANLTPELEGETAGDAVSTSSSYCAGGAYAAQELVTGWYDSHMLDFALSSALLNACAGGQYKIFVKFAPETAVATLAAAKYKAIIKYASAVLWTSPQVQPMATDCPPRMRDMWTGRLPPWSNASSSAALTLDLRGSAATAITVGVDFLYLLPVGEGSYLHLWANGYAAVKTERVVYDGMVPVVYSTASDGTARVQPYQAIGSVLLQPGKLQRLYMLWDNVLNTADAESANQTISVKVFYRPRRLTL